MFLFLGKDIFNILSNYTEAVREKIISITNIDIGNNSIPSVCNNFFDVMFVKNKLLFKVVKFDKEDKSKYPKSLDIDKDRSMLNSFEKDKFYVINFDRPKSNTNKYILFSIIFIVVSLCLFPLWPLFFKLLVWYFLVGILIFLVRKY